jgi:hypothetical protein
MQTWLKLCARPNGTKKAVSGATVAVARSENCSHPAAFPLCSDHKAECLAD